MINKRYRLYCPKSPLDTSGDGYNSFKDDYYYCEENTVEHLIKIGEMMEWYQIMDLRDKRKVINENKPIKFYN